MNFDALKDLPRTQPRKIFSADLQSRLSKRKIQLWQAIYAYIEAVGYADTVEEKFLGAMREKGFHLSRSTWGKHLRDMAKEELLDAYPMVIKPKQHPFSIAFASIPLFGPRKVTRIVRFVLAGTKHEKIHTGLELDGMQEVDDMLSRLAEPPSHVEMEMDFAREILSYLRKSDAPAPMVERLSHLIAADGESLLSHLRGLPKNNDQSHS